MIAKFKFLLLYFLSWIIFFDLMRILFLVYHADKARQLPFSTLLLTFGYGFRMDASVSAYIILPICLFVILSLVSHFFRRLLIYKIYTFAVLLVVAIISLCDLEIYNAWGFRMDASPLRFLSTPREALASVSHLPLVFILIVFIISYGLFLFCFRYILKRIFFQQQNRHKTVTAVLLLLFMGILFLPIRGGFQQAPLNQSSVYFSTRNFANHAAINVTWNFLHSVFSKGTSGKNPYLYLPANQVRPIVDSLYTHSDSIGHWVNFPADHPTNVIVVIWESFTEKALHISRNGVYVTPQFNKWKQQGIFFSNSYASGDRTNKGVPAVLSGYPAMPNTTVIHSPGKSVKLTVLSQLFRDRGYSTPFFYGGEPEFANIKSYLLHGGFDPIVGKNDFPASAMNSKWGAHDGVVMERVLKDLSRARQPFFATWLTLSSHEPFETPVPVAFPGDDIPSKFLNSLHYTDQVVGDFIDRCSKEPWWKNTVMIIVGDHGHPLPETGLKSDNFRTPMLWIGGALTQTGVVIDKVVSQLDIAATLAGQARLPAAGFPFSKNLFDPATRPWAFFTFNDGFGFIDSSGRLVFDNVGKQPIEKGRGTGANAVRAGQAMMQEVYGDFLKK